MWHLAPLLCPTPAQQELVPWPARPAVENRPVAATAARALPGGEEIVSQLPDHKKQLYM